MPQRLVSAVERPAPSSAVLQPFPARSRTVDGQVNGIETSVAMIHFADKILLMISQGGRLAQWVHVPLEASDPDPAGRQPTSLMFDDDEDDVEDAGPNLLPMSHLTATSILGASTSERDTAAQLCATQIASAIMAKHADERRLLVVGLGLRKDQLDSAEQGEVFMDLLGLVLQII